MEQVQTYPVRTDADGSQGRSRPGRAWWAGVAAVFIVQALTVAALTKRSYFFAEDFRFLAELHDGPIDADLLGYNVFGHFVPGLALGNHLFSQAFGTSWTAASVVILLFQLGGSIAFLRLLLALHGPEWWVPWATAAFSLSVVMLNNAVWWAATWTMGATTVCAVSAFGCAQRYFNTRRRRHLLSLAVMAALSFSFFEKSVVLCVYVGLFVLFVGGMSERETWAQRFRTALSVWPVWVVLAVVASIDLAIYQLGPYSESRSAPPGASLTAEYMLRALPEGSFTSVFGIVLPSVDPPGPSWLVPLVTSTILLLLIGWTSRRSRLAGRAWLWFLVCALVSHGFVALGRLSVLGVEQTAHMLRYQVDTNYLLLVTLTIALSAAVRTLAEDTRARLHGARAKIAAGLVLVLLPGWAASVRAISEDSPGRDADVYFSALRADGTPPKPFLDVPVPDWVVPANQYPWNMPSRIFEQIDPGAETTVDPRGARAIAIDGKVHDVELQPLHGPVRSKVCLDPSPIAVSLVDGMQMPQQPVWDPLMVVVDYVARGSGRVVFTGQDPSGQPVLAGGTLQSDYTVEGAGRVAFPTTVALSELGVVVEGARVCFRSFGIAVVR
ncbi:hypothetical protein EXE58_09215 [Nocardioides seonyuensis]|uniref:Glycosyltransferase RgtA/B/C/D-like domain-containing protein n=1 Tax=Nocardioides seonyuensis TaxID=2518371 RepID=A0A4P7IEF0_9ACTN|nr:hypothetical protein [Nocardioides seonyuensis]QBX55614.1 hypothetical protein EXE58_09215 [Nocardioides seonyuensis]